MIPSQEALQEAVALMTSAVGPIEEIDELIHRALDEMPGPDVVLALVVLGRELAYAAARLVHAVDKDLTDAEVLGLTDDAVRPAALSVLQAYGRQVASGTEG